VKKLYHTLIITVFAVGCETGPSNYEVYQKKSADRIEAIQKEHIERSRREKAERDAADEKEKRRKIKALKNRRYYKLGNRFNAPNVYKDLMDYMESINYFEMTDLRFVNDMENKFLNKDIIITGSLRQVKNLTYTLRNNEINYKNDIYVEITSRTSIILQGRNLSEDSLYLSYPGYSVRVGFTFPEAQKAKLASFKMGTKLTIKGNFITTNYIRPGEGRTGLSYKPRSHDDILYLFADQAEIYTE
jgi:hypothetical protein